MMAKYDNTKFYWLQLKEDFFEEDAIDWLEEQPNGKEYSLFYLKLCLKSLRQNGFLYRQVGEMIVPYDFKKLGEITKTHPDTVAVALKLLTDIGLVKVLENGQLYIAQVENMIGSQSKSAFKKQQQRLNSSLALERGGQMSTKCPPKIDIELEKEKEEDIKKESIINNTKEKQTKRFVKPTIKEIKAYCKERNNTIDAEYFYDYYESNGWKVNKNSMKDWKATIRNWERNQKNNNKVKEDKKEKDEYERMSDWFSNRKVEVKEYSEDEINF